MRIRALLVSALLLAATAALAQDPASPPEPALDPAPVRIGTQPADTRPVPRPVPDPAYVSVVCPFKGDIRYEPGQVSCGLLTVPENREKPDSRLIRLHVVTLHAREPEERRPDPVIYLTGGPGAPVTMYVERFLEHGLLETRDLIILEQRGIGASGEFCAFYGQERLAERQAKTFDEQERLNFEKELDCARAATAAGVDLTGYHSFENARDVKALREALGHAQWNVWGISYGSMLGQALVKVDADGIRALVLDAIVPLDLTDLRRYARMGNRLIDRHVAACAEQPACAAAYPDLKARWRAAIQAMAEAPVTVPVRDREAAPSGEVTFFQNIVGLLPFGLTYEEENHAAVPAVIDGIVRMAETRDPKRFRALAAAMGMGAPGADISWGMHNAITCLDGFPQALAAVAEEERAADPVMAGMFGTPENAARAVAACEAAGLPMRDRADYAPVTTDIPTLIANGAWDPVTPPYLAQIILPGFTNGQYVEFPHAGHGPTRSVECAGEFLTAFFDDPAKPVDLACAREGQEAATYLRPVWPTAFVANVILQAERSIPWAVAAAVWGLASALLLALAGLFYPAAALGRAVDRRSAESAEYTGEPVDTGYARPLAFATAVTGLVYVAGSGAAAGLTVAAAEPLILFGLVHWAGWFAWLAPLLGLLGIAVLVRLVMVRRDRWLPLGTLLGVGVTGVTALSLSVFTLVWGLWPV